MASNISLPVARAQIPPPTDAPRPLSPSASAAAYRLPEGFTMENIASEPQVASPTGVCWDERGRMFVSELHGYNLEGQLDIEELNRTGKLDTQVRRVQADERFKQAARTGTYGVVKLLRDTDGDGRMDHVDTWASDLPPVYGLVPARGGVIVASAPDIIYLADRDGDERAEVRERLFTGFATGALERGINAPTWGDDGWIYFGRGWRGGVITGPHLAKPVALPDSDFRIRADGTAIEPVTGGTHTFGFAITDAGDRFVVSTTIPALFVAPLPWRYLARNPDAATPPLEAATGDRRVHPLAPPHPWRAKRAQDAAYFKYYRDRYGAAESEADGWFTAACGPLVYRDWALPGLHGQYFVAEPAGNLIHRALIEADGSTLTVRRAPGEERTEFAASGDPWAHPIFLTHGPDGAIWVVDYYREIIEDYSAIPRHLQQQYGVYAGHDRGRIHRLVHRSMPPVVAPDTSTLDTGALAGELGSPLTWRRQTAQRLLVERNAAGTAMAVRRILASAATKNAGGPAPITVIAALYTLEALGSVTPADLRPWMQHPDAAVRIRALQLADRWFGKREGRTLLDAALAAARAERDPRVLLQFALSFGESSDGRAFSMLARFARDDLGIRWMDAALLSSLHGRAPAMLAALIADPGGAVPLLAPLARSIAAGGDMNALARALQLVVRAPADVRPALLDALASGRKNAARNPLTVAAARRTLAALIASPNGEIHTAASALAETFGNEISTTAAPQADNARSPVVMPVSDATFRTFVAALGRTRDLARGHVVFQQACAVCHRVGNEGAAVGPDLLGELGVAEETLIRHLLLPDERIRPGYETTQVDTRAGVPMVGLLKEEGATSLTLLAPGGVEQVLLRKDVTAVRRLPGSLMPSFEALAPADVAHLLGWLRSVLHAPAPNAARTDK